jgi:hypothetical protein
MSKSIDVQPALIFIPDISGFTKFINEVEIDHSTHIIAELLEVIIESNIINLKVSELEGDAVLFYRLGDAPTAAEILKKAEVMFLEFHRHLKLYEERRICQCGACSSADKLSLKFVTHYGHVTMRDIYGHKKLFGPDVTIAHRLLKNSISDREYLLLTFPQHYDGELRSQSSLTLIEGSDSFEDIGEIIYHYFPLTKLKSGIAELSEQRSIEKYRRPVSASQTINSSLKKVHGIATNASLKPHWIVGLKYVKEEQNTLSRIGSKHLCVMPAMSMDFEVTSQKIKEGLIEYAEKTSSIKWLSPITVFYTMERLATDKMKMTVDVHYKPSILSKMYIDFPLRIMIKAHAKLSLRKLRGYMMSIPDGSIQPRM